MTQYIKHSDASLLAGCSRPSDSGEDCGADPVVAFIGGGAVPAEATGENVQTAKVLTFPRCAAHATDRNRKAADDLGYETVKFPDHDCDGC